MWVTDAVRFEFRHIRNGMVTCQICRTDSNMTVIPYLYSAVASCTPIISIAGADTALFNVYENEFECLWELAE